MKKTGSNVWGLYDLIFLTVPVFTLAYLPVGSIGTHQRSFERYHPRPPTASPAIRLGVFNPTQNCNRYYIRNGKAKDYKFGRYIHRVHPNKSPLKIWEKMECGRIQGLSKFLSNRYYLKNG